MQSHSQPLTSQSDIIAKLLALLEDADSLIFAAGAGMGVDSGLPDFRGNQGMWQAYPALGHRQMDFAQIANPQAFVHTPNLAWGFYGHRLALYRDITPHQGFYDLLQIADSLGLNYFVFTSNVDGQFHKAGFDPHAIYECHGSIHHLQCLQPCCRDIWPADISPVIDEEACQWQGVLPTCRHCGGLARPNILMFGDWSWLSDRSDDQSDRLQAFLSLHQRPLVIEIGAGKAIPSVRNFAERFAPRHVRINLTDSEVNIGNGVGMQMTGKEGIALLKQAAAQLFVE